jgi:hypothetical protein
VTVHYFPIRHHGPGSAASLVRALGELSPVAVLIEGPVDATAILPALGSPQMRPPVALLCYPKGEPARAAFWPFAEFSPEYQAALWALEHGAEVRFIDLPAAAHSPEAANGGADGGAPAGEAPDGVGRGGRGDGIGHEGKRRPADPIGELARAAGYEDGESWWCDLLEQNPAPGPVFAAVSDAMAALRAGTRTEDREAKREAHMRLRIAEAARAAAGPVAVVCGAWHVPALRRKTPASADRRLLAGLPRAKAVATWAPWSQARLAFGGGYGAGVAAPGWNLHLWRSRDHADGDAVWLTRIARLLRERGHEVSPASLIEAERLARALAALRDRPRAGFEELREAAVACLFGGETPLWDLIEAELLLGPEVGQVPEGAAAAPLIEDVQRAQRQARLKPEALERELTLDLRTESGRKRSLLLHRLAVLGVDWGVPLDQGSSRGTFRENWRLRWEPEFSVVLVERVVYGADLAGAAGAYLDERMRRAASLGSLAEAVGLAVAAELPGAWELGLELLEAKAAQTSDVEQLLGSVPPLADTARYGQARQVDTEPLRRLAERLAVEAALGLRHAARNLDDAASEALVGRLRAAHLGLRVLEADPATDETWLDALTGLVGDTGAAPGVAGCAAQLLYAAERLTPDQAVELMERRLSPGTPAPQAARFIEGFFTTQAARLIYDAPLRGAVDRWVRGLDAEDFLANLPLLRRVLSELDSMERKRLLNAVFARAGERRLAGFVAAPEGVWEAHLRALAPLLGAAAGGRDG